MYTAASPGNLLPKFSGPADGGTIARRASLLQKRTGAGENDVLPAKLVRADARPAEAVAATTAASTTRINLVFITAPFATRSPRRHAAARAQLVGRRARPRGPTAR